MESKDMRSGLYYEFEIAGIPDTTYTGYLEKRPYFGTEPTIRLLSKRSIPYVGYVGLQSAHTIKEVAESYAINPSKSPKTNKDALKLLRRD